MIESRAVDVSLCARESAWARQWAPQQFSLETMMFCYQGVYETL